MAGSWHGHCIAQAMSSMPPLSTPPAPPALPATPAPPFWADLPAALGRFGIAWPLAVPLVWEGERPQRRHIYLSVADAPAATVSAYGLALALAPGAELFAAALIAAFLAPEGRPAAVAPASLNLLALAGRVAAAEVSVLIEGATGTGKEGLARMIHALSPRRDASLVAVNCAALPEAMLEATLFGHERGAFTGAVGSSAGLFRAADGGTLFLDEVAELPLALQAKLLRALQEREVMPVGATKAVPVDVRLVACGNRDLAGEVAAGRFRADLYYRLAVFPLRTLPLAERVEDVPAIAAAIVLRRARERLVAARGGEMPVAIVAPAAMAQLQAHGWPGNVRELGNVLDRALVLGCGAAIGPEALVFDFVPAPVAVPAPVVPAPQPLASVRAAEEDRAISRVLAAAPSRRAAAQRLGISERTLRYKLAAMASRATGLNSVGRATGFDHAGLASAGTMRLQ